MKSDLIPQYHFLILDLIEIDKNSRWERVLKETGYNYDMALNELINLLLEMVINPNIEQYDLHDEDIKDYKDTLKRARDIKERNR